MSEPTKNLPHPKELYIVGLTAEWNLLAKATEDPSVTDEELGRKLRCFDKMVAVALEAGVKITLDISPDE